MKTTTVLASALFAAGTTLAAPMETYYTLQASAPNTAIDGSPLNANAGYFFLNKPSTSSCGDVSPAVTIYSAGSMLFYNDGTSNQQQGFVDTANEATKGLLAFTKGDNGGDTRFSLAGSEQDQIKLFFDGESDWLACPDSGAGFYVYSKKANPNPANKDNCIPFDIKPVEAKSPKVCTFE